MLFSFFFLPRAEIKTEYWSCPDKTSSRTNSFSYFFLTSRTRTYTHWQKNNLLSQVNSSCWRPEFLYLAEADAIKTIERGFRDVVSQLKNSTKISYWKCLFYSLRVSLRIPSWKILFLQYSHLISFPRSRFIKFPILKNPRFPIQ